MSGFDSFAILSILGLILIFILNIKIFMAKTSKQHSPPGPKPWPVIGNLHILNLKRPYQTMQELSQKYGSIYSIQMGPKKVVVLSGYETVKEALVGYGNQFGERSQVPIFERIFNGKGIAFSHGETWKIMRRFSLTTLRNFGMGKQIIEDIIIEECQHLIKNFEAHRGNPFEITTVMNASVANIIVSVLFGKRFEYQDPQFLRLLTLIGENVKLVGSPRIVIFNMFPVLGFLLRSHKTVLKNRDELFSFIRKTFLDHRHKFDKNDPRSFIDAFLVRQQEEKDASADYFSDENLVALVSNLFAAGTETTVSTLRWGILLMMRYPEVQKKVCDEITKVVGLAQPRIAHRTQMPYTDAVIHEVQRFANILPTSLPHATTTNVTFKNYYIPKGTEVITLLTSVLQDPTQWEKPHTFNPEHFLNSKGKFVKREAFMPFSVGNRKCVGESLARMELFLFFTSLMQKFTFQPPQGVSHLDLDLTPDIGFTTRPMPHKICALLRV
ncbi:cytochrome P450 2K1-like [Ictidomys tridecemlineatus]|uniref:Cytochrome P450 n=1 Tax=Ictidomys tridecemlineatus TaxID=43179 RepID=I3NH60_ICTTR|nr:cytochrome P450 2K6-like [Ictidomys tridecemlineatus]KAG3289601.1 cytochrome P450 2K1-like [Ictidomys tridecemlineatus]